MESCVWNPEEDTLTVVTAGGDGFPPPGPLSCTKLGCARNVSIGCLDSRPSTCTPVMGMPHCIPPKGRKSYISKDLLGGW